MRRALTILLKTTKGLMTVVAGLVLLVLAGWFVIPDETLRDEAAQILRNKTDRKSVV